jgi:hypothetical protein
VHRTIILSGRAQTLEELGRELTALEDVISLTHARGASLKPAGDTLTIHVLNQGADDVLRRAQRAIEAGELSVALFQSTALVDARRQKRIETDADEALWEEMESSLRNHGRISANFTLLMALGGVVAAVGLVLEPVSQAIAFVGASVIAPGFEPVAKVAQGLVLRDAQIAGRGAASVLLGYATLTAAAALTYLLLRATGHASLEEVRAQPVLEVLSGFGLEPLLMSACAAVAGVVMVVTLRDTYVVGALMLLVLIPGTALVGTAVAAGDGHLALAALGRVGLDVLFIVVLGAGVFFWKQRRIHRRGTLS